MRDAPAAATCRQSGWGTTLQLPYAKQTCCDSTTASLRAASPTPSARERGKYAKRYHAGTNLVLLDPDVHKAFRSGRAVNDALRLVIELRKV